jgi:hypothetical protein
MKYEVLKHYKNNDNPEIVFRGDFEECISFCEKKYKRVDSGFPQVLIWEDEETLCEIYANLGE